MLTHDYNWNNGMERSYEQMYIFLRERIYKVKPYMDLLYI